MYTFTNSFGSMAEATKEKGFTTKFSPNERGFTANGETTYVPESVIELEIVLFPEKKLKSGSHPKLYLLKMVDGNCGWVSSDEMDQQVAEHITRIKENLKHGL